jgi:hypothetical protein
VHYTLQCERPSTDLLRCRCDHLPWHTAKEIEN